MTLAELEQKRAAMLEHAIDVSIGDGWVPLVDELLTKLAAIGGVQISQIKQKLGTLEVYTGELDDAVFDEVHALIDEYRRRSVVTCEACGQPGRGRSEGWWLHVACDQHVRPRR